MNIDLRTIHLLRMKTLTIAILLAYLAGQLTRFAYTLDGAIAIVSGVGAVVVGVLTIVNTVEALTWHRQYHRVQDHLRCLDCGVKRNKWADNHFCSDHRDPLGWTIYRNDDGSRRALGEHNWPPPTRTTFKKD